MKSIKRCWIVVLFSILIFGDIGTSFALEPATHEALNDNIALGNYAGCFPLDNYLKNNLGFKNGVTENFNIKSVHDWIRYGGSAEDLEPMAYVRSTNHFHDPTVPGHNWALAGFN